MESKLRIAVWHNLPSGGGKRALYNHVKALKARGHYIESWTTDLEMSYLPLSELITEHIIPNKTEVESCFGIKSPVRKKIKLISVLQSHAEKCAKDISRGGFDIVFANSCVYSYMSYIGLYSDKPAVIYLGEPFRQLYEAFPSNVWQAPHYPFSLKNINKFRRDFEITYARRIQVREEIKAAASYRSILVNSMFSKESVRRAYGIGANVCYLGIDENEFTLEDCIKEPFITGIGKISDSKGIDIVINSVALIEKPFRPQIRWISNGYDEEYFQYLQNLAYDKKVEFIPLIDIDDHSLREVLRKASVMVYTPKLEPFGLAPLEANMCGTWVIAIAEGGVRESIVDGKNGTLFPKMDESRLAEAITKFCKDRTYAGSMGKMAREHSQKHWNYTSMGDNIESELLSAAR